MSDEHYFSPPRNDRPRHHSGPFHDLPYGDYEEFRNSSEDPSERIPLNLETIRRLMKERNPHGE